MHPVDYSYFIKIIFLCPRHEGTYEEQRYSPLILNLRTKWRLVVNFSFCMKTFSVSLTIFAVLLPQSRGSSCYVRRRILTPPPCDMQNHTDIPHTVSRIFPNCVTCLGSLTIPPLEARLLCNYCCFTGVSSGRRYGSKV